MYNVLNQQTPLFGTFGEVEDGDLTVDIRQVKRIIGTGTGFSAEYRLIDIKDPGKPYTICIESNKQLSIEIAFESILLISFFANDNMGVRYGIEKFDNEETSYFENGKNISASKWWAVYGNTFIGYVTPYKKILFDFLGEDITNPLFWY